MTRFLMISVCVLFCAVLVKDKNRPIAAVLSVAGGCILFAVCISEIGDIARWVKNLSGEAPSGAQYIKLMLKVLSITLMTQLVCDICRDNGENALASMTEAVCKILVISMVLPLFETVITIVSNLVK